MTVVKPPVLTKTFASSSIPLGATTRLTFKITNPNTGGAAMYGLSFDDLLPSGLTVAKATTSACGGTFAATPPRTITFSNGSRLMPGTSCSFSVTVTGTAAGVFTNRTSKITCSQGCQGLPAEATLTVVAP